MRLSLRPRLQRVPVLRVAGACLLALALAWRPGPVAAEAGPERSVKAAFLLKFVGYVEFPAAPPAAAPLVIGVAGADDIGAELSRLAARGAGGRPVLVRSVQPDDSLAGLHVLFVGGGDSARADRLLRAAARAGVLSVTESNGGLREGAVINFRLVEERVRFEVSLDAADRANLKLSSRLLSVAYLVQRSPD